MGSDEITVLFNVSAGESLFMPIVLVASQHGTTVMTVDEAKRLIDALQNALVNWQKRWPWHPGYWWISDGEQVHFTLIGGAQVERFARYKTLPNDWYAEVVPPKPPTT